MTRDHDQQGDGPHADADHGKRAELVTIVHAIAALDASTTANLGQLWPCWRRSEFSRSSRQKSRLAGT